MHKTKNMARPSMLVPITFDTACLQEQNRFNVRAQPYFSTFMTVAQSSIFQSKASKHFGLLLLLWQVMVMQEGSTSLFGQHLKLPTLTNSSLTSTFSEPKKGKSFQGSKVSVVSSHSLELDNLLLCLHSQPHPASRHFTSLVSRR